MTLGGMIIKSIPKNNSNQYELLMASLNSLTAAASSLTSHNEILWMSPGNEIVKCYSLKSLEILYTN